jgi:hypothetical protein
MLFGKGKNMSEYNNLNDAPREAGDISVTPREVHKTRAWSVAALVLSIISVLCCCVYWLGLVCGIFSIVCVIVSRKTLGYFDGLSVASIIVSIFGIVFSSVMIYVVYGVMSDPKFQELMKNYNISLEAFRLFR